MLTGRRYGGTWVTSLPSMTMRPWSGVSNPAISRSSVVLPQPDGPSSANNSPSSTDSDTPSTAAIAPNFLPTASISKSAIASRSAAGLDPVPGAGTGALVVARRRQVDIEQLFHSIGWVDARIVADLRLDQCCRRRVGVGIADRIADRGDHLRPQDVVDELERVVGVRRVLGNAKHVDRELRPLLGHPEGDVDPVLGVGGAVACLDHVARIAERDADIAIRQIVDVLRRVELAHIGPDFEQQRRRLVEIAEVAALGVEAEKSERGGEHLLRRIEQ